MRNGLPLNNNRNNNNNNNRRRGRGNRNQGGGGGNQANRIDSRARGNAPQLLDKYKKLAEDAHRNGDRVQAEYYLQFADHYFRVIADNRARQDEQRGDQRSGRRDDREQDDFDSDFDDDGEDRRRFESRDREDRGRDNRERDTRRERPRQDKPRDDGRDEDGERAPDPAFEPEDNPFVREARDNRERAEPREERPRRRAPRPRRDAASESESNGSTGIDAAALPPSFSASDGEDGGEAPKPAARPRRKRSEGGTLSAVG